MIRRKMTLNQMYGWIRENFAFYRTGDQCWQVSCILDFLASEDTKFFVGTFAKGLEHLSCQYFLLSQHENGLICLPQYDFDGWNISKAVVVTRTHQNVFFLNAKLAEF